jgi:sulfopropanediol 3-dehydrogenase
MTGPRATGGPRATEPRVTEPRVLKSASKLSHAPGSDPAVADVVAAVIAEVRARGDDAVREYSARFDNWSPESFRLSGDDIERIVSAVPREALEDIDFAQAQVRGFAERQRESLADFEVETLPGVHLGQRNIPIAAAGTYVPGGRYPLTASAHMTIVTAKVAGVSRVTACSPPIRGQVPAATVAAMARAGADEIYLLGGVQAIAAMALGTQSIEPVDMIAGPGNAYVAEAKRQLFGEVGIDLLAGPTEILIIADDSADSFTVAVDLLSQAEHGPDSPAILITTSVALAEQVAAQVEAILPDMPTADFAGPAWRDYGQVLVTDGLDEAYVMADLIASEHVEVLTRNPREALGRLRNYGALFLGAGTCVSYGDKVIGTNHVLPTRRTARFGGGLWVGKYLKTVTYQEVTDPVSSARLGEVCGRAARVELFEGHARAADLRVTALDGALPDWAAGLGGTGQ